VARIRSRSIRPGGVDEYIAACPQAVRAKLKRVRAAIRLVAPGAVETVSYFQMPGYSYKGYDYNGMFAWFSFKEPNVRLHVRPPAIQQQRKKDLAGYATTKALVIFPADEEIPVALVKKLVRASVKLMKDKSR
jgi:uncharacterized protein YdhG (YjbR/CyaY superfamily)